MVSWSAPIQEFRPCECCKINWANVSTTFSVGKPFKWTRKDIEWEIIVTSEKLANARWYQRGELRARLKHWTDKLKKFNEAKEEFKF